MSTFPLGAYVGPNLAATQLLMSAAANGSAGSPKDLSSPGLPMFPRIPSLQDYAAASQQQYLPHFAAAMADPTMLYNALNGSYDLKENAEAMVAWRHLAQQSGSTQPTSFLPFENPASAGISAPFPYPGYPGMDLNSARRKNATRETTSTLKAWLYEHKKNPYPTKGEKIMLAIFTKMTLTQVSTWFANARRRLKKENRMTWLPRNRTGDGSSVDGDESKNDDLADEDDVSIDLSDFDDNNKESEKKSEDESAKEEAPSCKDANVKITAETNNAKLSSTHKSLEKDSKPRIWSIADVAASKPSFSNHSSSQASVRHRPYPNPAFRPWFDATTAYRQQLGGNLFANSLLAARPTILAGLRIPHFAPPLHSSALTTSAGTPSPPISAAVLSSQEQRKTSSSPERSVTSNPSTLRPMKLEV